MSTFFKNLFGSNDGAETSASDEMTHINQEMYKKSLELSARNKTLLLLRKIDEIILSSITDKIEIGKHVTSLLISETDFQIVSIFLYDKTKGELNRLSLSTQSKVINQDKALSDNLFVSHVAITDRNNLIVQTVTEQISKSSNNLSNSLLPKGGFISDQANNLNNIKSVITYPLKTREQLMGVMVVALTDEEQNISEYTKDLLERLVQIIGIAIDNASLYTDLQNANEKLKVLDKLKDEFVSLASHELRTPMTAIKSYLWMTLQGDAGVLNDTQKLYLERSYNSVERLIKLVNDMLNISRIESGRVTVEMQKVNLSTLVQEVINDVMPRASEVGVRVVVSPFSDLPAVLADPDKIKEVLFNLIGNSLKFTPKDGTITISFNQNGEMIETQVTDTGAGISKENIAKLFQKFSMLPDSYTVNKNASGTGLGLYISRCIVELHHGKIWATSEGLGKGSQFSFSLKKFDNEDLKAITSQSPGQKEKIGIVHSKI